MANELETKKTTQQLKKWKAVSNYLNEKNINYIKLGTWVSYACSRLGARAKSSCCIAEFEPDCSVDHGGPDTQQHRV
jgi:hypothetical protein